MGTIRNTQGGTGIPWFDKITNRMTWMKEDMPGKSFCTPASQFRMETISYRKILLQNKWWNFTQLVRKEAWRLRMGRCQN